jgi:hypothetical protein
MKNPGNEASSQRVESKIVHWLSAKTWQFSPFFSEALRFC